MGKLTHEQQNGLREFLERQGLSFKPLQDEMVDHMTCDLEERMREGFSFQQAWDQSINEIPNNHFQIIQKEVMETINKRFTWSQVFSFGALGLILIGTVLKELHMPLAGEAMLLSFGFLAISLLTGSLSGISVNKGKRGSIRLLAVVAGIVILLIGFGFKFMHLPGADQLVLLAVAVLVISVVVNSISVYRHASGEGNLLTYLHEKYTPGIERFLLFLFFPLVIYKTAFIFTGSGQFIGGIVLLVLIFAAGIQLIVLSWRVMEKDLSKRNMITLVAIILCSLCFLFPFLGPILSLQTRVILIALFSPIAGWLAYTTDDETSKPISLILLSLVSTVFLGWALIQLNALSSSNAWVFFNIPILVVFVAGVLICRKQGTMRTFMLISAAGYMFEYIMA